MNRITTGRWLILASVSLVVALTLGVSIASSTTPHSTSIGSAPDSAAVERLTSAQRHALPASLTPSIAITETAAILSANLLLGGYDFKVDLPVVVR